MPQPPPEAAVRAGRIRQHLQQAHGTGPRWAQLHLHALGAIALFKRGQRDELDAMPLATALPTSIPPAGREDRCLRISDCLRTSDELCATRERPPWASPARLPPLVLAAFCANPVHRRRSLLHELGLDDPARRDQRGRRR